LTSPVLGKERAHELAAVCWKFLELDDVCELVNLTDPA
jgi:hypothetical protein